MLRLATFNLALLRLLDFRPEANDDEVAIRQKCRMCAKQLLRPIKREFREAVLVNVLCDGGRGGSPAARLAKALCSGMRRCRPDCCLTRKLGPAGGVELLRRRGKLLTRNGGPWCHAAWRVAPWAYDFPFARTAMDKKGIDPGSADGQHAAMGFVDAPSLQSGTCARTQQRKRESAGV